MQADGDNMDDSSGNESILEGLEFQHGEYLPNTSKTPAQLSYLQLLDQSEPREAPKQPPPTAPGATWYSQSVYAMPASMRNSSLVKPAVQPSQFKKQQTRSVSSRVVSAPVGG